MFDLADLEKLLAVYECGTLLAAAERLHISQPALTRAMQKLEDELGCPLFVRTKNKIELNEAGELAVAEAKKVVHAAERMQERMEAHIKNHTAIAIGACAPGPLWVVWDRLQSRFPDTEITGSVVPKETLMNGLKNETYRLLITDAPIKESGIVCKELLTERLSVSLPPAHPLASKPTLTFSDLAGQTMLLYADLGVWNELKATVMKDIRFIVQNEMEAFADLVSLSVLPSFDTNLHDPRPEQPIPRVKVPLTDPEASRTFYLCALKKDRKLLEHSL